MLTASARRALWVSLVVLAVLILLAPDPALAAPGGIVKAAARTFLGKLVLGVLVVVFLPLIVWLLIKRAVLVRRTRQALSRLAARVPHFAWLPLKERVSEVFAWVHSAWDQGKMDLARDYMTAWYVRNQQLQLDKWERDGLRNVTSDVKIKNMTPLYVSHDPASGVPDRIVLEIEAEMRDYLVEQATGKVAQGDKTLGTSTSVWSFVHEDGHWLLTNIEPEATVFPYLEEASRVLAAQAKPIA
jgi:hypothetical protein